MSEKGLHHHIAAAGFIFAANLSPEATLHSGQIDLPPVNDAPTEQQIALSSLDYVPVGQTKINFGKLPMLDVFGSTPQQKAELERLVVRQKMIPNKLPLEVIIESVQAKIDEDSVKQQVDTPIQTETLDQKRLQEISDLVSAVDISFNGATPETSHRALSVLLENGYSLNGSSAVWGALIQESRGRPDAISPDGYYRGLAQWGPGRYYSVGASPYDTLEEQLFKVIEEMKNRYPNSYQVLTDNSASIGYSISAMHWFEGESIPGNRGYYSNQIAYRLNDRFYQMNYLFFNPGVND